MVDINSSVVSDNPAILNSMTSRVIQAIDPEDEEDYLAKMDARISAIQISKEELEGPEWKLIGKMMNWDYNKKLIYALHSDLAFIGTDGEIHLVEENVKPDYNEWNW